MHRRIQRTPEVWAQLVLSSADEDRVREALSKEFRIGRRFIVRRMHLTVYHARRPMVGVEDLSESAAVMVPVVDTRFMVMAPGGENPRPEIEPAQRMVGIRIRRNTAAMNAILSYRDRLLERETKVVLGGRRASDHRRNAFGARHFQAHVSLLRAGSGIDRDLTQLGERFRGVVGDLLFDRFQVKVTFPRLANAL